MIVPVFNLRLWQTLNSYVSWERGDTESIDIILHIGLVKRSLRGNDTERLIVVWVIDDDDVSLPSRVGRDGPDEYPSTGSSIRRCVERTLLATAFLLIKWNRITGFAIS